jgi:hypothetical protein
VSVVDPLEQLPGKHATGPVRYVANSLRGLWDGKVFPLYRQKVYLGYDYGARVEATEILKGKLSATVAVKFWRFKKKWRTTLVNFGNADHGFKHTSVCQSSIGRAYGQDVTSLAGALPNQQLMAPPVEP